MLEQFSSVKLVTFSRFLSPLRSASTSNWHSVNDKEVSVQDPFFPISINTYKKEEFEKLLSQSSRNDR